MIQRWTHLPQLFPGVLWPQAAKQPIPVVTRELYSSGRGLSRLRHRSLLSACSSSILRPPLHEGTRKRYPASHIPQPTPHSTETHQHEPHFFLQITKPHPAPPLTAPPSYSPNHPDP